MKRLLKNDRFLPEILYWWASKGIKRSDLIQIYTTTPEECLKNANKITNLLESAPYMNTETRDSSRI